MKISIGSDHRGVELKSKIISNFLNIEWVDVGAYDLTKTDYPIYAKKVAQNILDNNSELGILICGSGVGMSIAANRYKHIYAALCWNPEVAAAARCDDMANILALPADYISLDLAFEIVNAWLKAEFKGGRYQTRLDMTNL
ncbi:RpiB/LacA/LacB family sugar-phosphate isomerase [Candidatus Dependentiae bacterium]|nr:RpiB/LacA/LacB family sugar-phosphate isomerase [Candidatus Dependentiae bacterium]MBU4387100.1 RpiB/LacA/LacB family sugar-phosphate isomerase [Candidatus Dependentiae bacterium]MCG2756518.1 RpiB/LacA/LacB family sugar-phosphate isomerase [Candidatus Dependentiae bacterium]